MDAQGAEGLIIDGAKKILSANGSLTMLMEFWPKGYQNMGIEPLQVLRTLREYGFKAKIIENPQNEEFVEDLDIINFCKNKEYVNLLMQK
jgi:hypothetical protein